jgi:NAD-dependent deacetylase
MPLSSKLTSMNGSLAEPIRIAASTLRQGRQICVLTGAGVSAESGVPTFRDAGGLWEGHAIDDVATPQGFDRNPRLVWRFYNARRRQLRTIQPNPAHIALAELERIAPAFTLITQNVDGLHRRAGSQRVIEIHGNLNTVRCASCGAERDASGIELPDVPTCGQCGGFLRPGVVWFGEMLPDDALEAASAAIDACDVLLVVGTSGVVQPAASFSSWAANHGARIIDVNPDPEAFSPASTVAIPGPAGRVLPEIVAQMAAR